MSRGKQPASENRRTYVLLVLLLASVAGTVNATGFFALGMHAAHMTGNIASVGEMLASGRWELAWASLRMVLVFLLGAMVAATLLDVSRHRTRGRHAAALLLEAVVLGGVGLWLSSHAGQRATGALWGLCFAMGLQNALVTRVSGAVVRTTHVTGVLTDIGIELARMAFWVREGAQGHGLGGLLQRLASVPSASQFERIRLHLGLLLAFLAGCALGPLLFLSYGPTALGLPTAVLLLLAALDLSPASELVSVHFSSNPPSR